MRWLSQSMEGDIVHINGPFPCGSHPDINIFESPLIYKLEPEEKVEDDCGYREENPVSEFLQIIKQYDKAAKVPSTTRYC